MTKFDTAPGRGETVLVVEDNPDVRVTIARLLDHLGYHVFQASDAIDAKKILRRQSIDLLLSDVFLPGRESGLDLADHARALVPGLKTLLMTADVNRAAEARGMTSRAAIQMKKPFKMEQLAETVRDALDR